MDEAKAFKVDRKVRISSHLADQAVRQRRAGLTLVELLVVVGIILLLLTIIVPRVQPGIEDQRLREAARSLNVFLAAARVRALESGQPVGVAFQRLAEQPNACRVVYQIQLPPPYAGETLDARVCVAINSAGPTPIVAKVSMGAIADGLVRPGDRIRFGHQGPWFVLAPISSDPTKGNPDSNQNEFIDFDQGVDANNDGFVDNLLLHVTAAAEGAPLPALPWPTFPNFGPPVPFLIQRMPNLDNTGFGGSMLRSSVPPLQLPDQVVIDLGASGIGAAGRHFAVQAPSAPPVLLIFSPTGSLEEAYLGGDLPANPFRRAILTEPIFFLVGSWERMPVDVASGVSPAEDGLLNWQDARNFWVAINPQNGLTTVAQVYADTVGPGGVSVPADLARSRQMARETQIAMGGR
ncbi:MAG: prepilin-type N-terminal cleavage/methylation domain-containing protein [Thermoguttaceae bacterium]|nr:prepilin-type N-terminal cleavage/methylation domain-containing protein [Thermoguttaceae bacterium]MDW8079398.1 prepilin-type N-terminal cleavage/methylation domain-containing protein [Thermoguttaceae bacterium]